MLKILIVRSILMTAIFLFAFNGSGDAGQKINLKSGQQILTVGEIKQSGKDFLLERVPWEEDQMNLRVMYEGENLFLPKGKLELDFQANGRTWRPGMIP
ncbi:MAG: hypothetical protein GY950_06820, partial [bacterium]|nr:hypothetical protein [bacterium]